MCIHSRWKAESRAVHRMAWSHHAAHANDWNDWSLASCPFLGEGIKHQRKVKEEEAHKHKHDSPPSSSLVNKELENNSESENVMSRSIEDVMTTLSLVHSNLLLVQGDMSQNSFEIGISDAFFVLFFLFLEVWIYKSGNKYKENSSAGRSRKTNC